MNILIIGATGYIGGMLYKKCKVQGYNVVGTCYSKINGNDFISYEIGENIDKLELSMLEKRQNKVAVICAGQSNISFCKSSRDEAYRINVVNTIKLIKQLKERKYKIIFCSTDNVYDGEKGYYTEQDKINPLNEYGKMKAEVEEYLLKECPDACILRLSKVVGVVESNKDMFCEWRDKALKGEAIYCIKDNIFSPVYIDDVVNCILKIIKRKLNGIYNVCGDNTYSRTELCDIFFEKINLKANVKEKRLEEFGFNDYRPLNTSMCNKKIAKDAGLSFFDYRHSFKEYMNEDVQYLI